MAVVKLLFMQCVHDSTVLVGCTSNAFNYSNYKVALHNMQPFSPPLATILISRDVPLFDDSCLLQSSEGTTQGNPLAMAMYSVGYG